MQHHSFYIALAYGAAALAIGFEVFGLWRHCRKEAGACTRKGEL